MSLASLFDIQTPSEYLKALTALMTEYEAFQDETIKPKVRNWLSTIRVLDDADRLPPPTPAQKEKSVPDKDLQTSWGQRVLWGNIRCIG